MKRIGPVAQAWYKWKALRLPWRKRFFVGYDLQGNTFWEFRLTTRGGSDTSLDPSASSERWRRIVHYPRSTHYSDVKVSPLWHQWLRHTRPDAPSLAEQRADVSRQERTKVLAAQADARWEAKPRVMEAPEDAAARIAPAGPVAAVGQEQQQKQQDAESEQQAARSEQQQPAEQETGSAAVKGKGAAASPAAAPENDPWAKARAQGPSEKWQPAAWTPTAAKKR
ncbi:hypothetical protein VFPFJ_05515 [Purpureocillium lilacinum]|uniref:Uncharacterized protein n=1 Tax=Purpureocillium lilacinum TaxID=33203 RepID=A0A179HFE2_PURLI|nr:hypothetical protein VFPFJ_05515 [Purpureocillium lilacinum]KAK4092373.1 hypothetical protein Purlil1_2994 [Purpureocillium lilacinum]OAQ84570.1 hypothetical protein VFPBJ_03338 [Purpureocillium lilacinum]OAQ89106.1 hypothetical protein VFPFJ_05515 [Purpureocillium lilacinum]GJN68839.1 hypothetical protein PLICBS_002884 [Purpureocillium lilacinum]GJN77484.1 hypothetical protein PLIIFM63780_000975 [Purpureocillium lilacinum]